MPYDRAQLTEAMKAAVSANAIGDGYIRLVVTRGKGSLGLNPFTCERPNVFIIADTIQLYPAELYETGLRVIIASTVRNNPNALSPRIKSLNYLNNILAKIEAIDADVPEAIMLNTAGLVAEATGDNVFIIRRGEVVTPPLNAGVLGGVTREVVMDLGREAGLCVSEAEVSRYDLYTCEECFLTGTAAEVVPVTAVDNRTIGDGKPGRITRQLMAAFKIKVRQEA
jgi:branched-chain amino acid aminotransferase